MNFNLHFCELRSDHSMNEKNNLFENYIPKCYIVKRILISFNCFSEYTSNRITPYTSRHELRLSYMKGVYLIIPKSSK